ncbi:MAG: hypothetical protein H7641_14065, partial [Candidatus Heimdallarchaeota archaeon]|nr:hypothetical protein [Candidatus Heimdallarchaeota archaeon]MCK4878688.1 hypothetical protein [Candidatus Heimdallarchaeota archaeon]
ISFLLLGSLLIISITCADTIILADACDDKIGSLIMRYHLGGASAPTYAHYIQQYLEEIGIEVTLINEDWEAYMYTLIFNPAYDITYVALTNGGATPEARSVYTENGSLNIFRFSKDIPYYNESEQMQNQAETILNLDERQQLYYDWQQLMMDKIVPILPLYTPNFYSVIWSNIKGYDMRWGFDASCPYMYFEGLHEGQESVEEFNIRDAMWSELNPILLSDTSSQWIYSLAADSLLEWSPDQIPLKTGVINDWEQISDNHYKFYMRDNIFWNPSFNVTGRNASSLPLVTESSPGIWEVTDSNILMQGLKAGEESNGINQQITAKDAVFTYLTLGNLNISKNHDTIDFISDIYVDPVNDLAFHIEVDGDPDTSEIEPYIDFFVGMNFNTLPEFFLNSSNPSLTYSSGGVETRGLYDEIVNSTQWQVFSKSCFGHGKYLLDYYEENVITVHTRSPFWFGIGAIDGVTGKTPFVESVNTHVIPDDHSSLADFKDGKLDYMGISSFPEERKLMQEDSRFEVQSEVRDYFLFLAFNLQREFVGGEDNKVFLTEPGKENYTKACAVRKAICYAIDREEMNNDFHDGEYIIAHNPMYPYTAFYYYDDVIKYDYNLDKAREWLEAAGYIETKETISTALSCILAIVMLQTSIFVKRRKMK